MGKNKKKYLQAEEFASKYCNPKDSEVISELDRNARQSAWALLQRIKHLEEQKCVCEECGSEVEEEEVAEDSGSKKEESETLGENKTSVSGESKTEKLVDIAESGQEVLKAASKHASKVVVGATVVAAASQTASAATPTVANAVTAFVQEAGQKVAAIGTAGLMSIGSGAYFQAKTVKTEGLEIAVVTEQQYGVFSTINKFTDLAFGAEVFKSIVEYSEKGYGDIKGKPVIASVTDATSSSVAPDTILSPEDLKTLGITFPPIKTPPTVTDVSGGDQ
ncbi:hypothetical protein N9973_00485 [bacterium]|nr:hypothetical protein [bacterium]